MAEVAQVIQRDISSETTRLRDIEERQRIINDRVVLLGQTLIDERDKTFAEIQEIKKRLIVLENELNTAKSFIKKLTEKTETAARKEELMILQRQFDLFREQKGGSQ